MEVDAHLELLTDHFLRQGLTPDEAYTAARRQFGNAALIRQDLHEMNTIGWIEQVVRTCATRSGSCGPARGSLPS